jgi:tRNA(fMet)-specific endonuclease VapC
LDVIEPLLARLAVLDFDLAAAEHAGTIGANLAAGGRPSGPYDTMIAGHARSLGSVLVTNNVGEFCRVAGLRLANWVE